MSNKPAVKQAVPASNFDTNNTAQFLQLIINSAKEACPFTSWKSPIDALRFMIKSFKHQHELKHFIKQLASVKFEKDIAINTDMVGVSVWPYLCNHWDVKTRLDKITEHYQYIETLQHSALAFVNQEAVTIADLSAYSENVSVVIDRPIWFRREGEAVINLFKDDLRVVSIAFIFGQVNEKPTITIGAIQGIHSGVPMEESLLIFKKLTKDFNGLRPRSFLIDLLKTMAQIFDIECLLAVSDENRHHRHAYFGHTATTEMNTDYNKIWEEHGGSISETTGFYELPIEYSRKPIESIASKKRAMYRRRYEMIDNIAADMSAFLVKQ